MWSLADETVDMKWKVRVLVRFFQTLGAGLLAASTVCAQTLDASTANFSDHGAGLRVTRSMLGAPRAESPGVVLPEALPATAETIR
jgi:hypothetical protein